MQANGGGTRQARRRRALIMMVLALALAGCRSGPLKELGEATGIGRRIVPNDWILVAISPDERVLRVQTSYGGEASGCNRWVGAEIDESRDRVSVRMLLSKAVAPGACTDELITRSATVRLGGPLGERPLVGCGAEPAACRDPLRDANGMGAPRTALIVAGNTVVVGETRGLVGLAADDGSERWRREAPPPHEHVQILHAADGLVFVDESRGELVALDAADGSERWRRPYRQAGWPRAAGLPVVLVNEIGTTVAAVDPGTGAERWRVRLPAGAAQSVAVGAGGVGLLMVPGDGSQGGDVHLLDLGDGATRWSAHVPERVRGLVVSAAAVMTAGPIVRYAWDPTDGSQRWRLPPLAEAAEIHLTAAGAVAVSGDAVFFDEVAGAEGRRLALRADGGGPVSVAVERDRLLLSAADGTLRMLDLDGLVRDVLPLDGLGGRASSGGGVIAVPTHLGVTAFGEDGGLRWWWVAEDEAD